MGAVTIPILPSADFSTTTGFWSLLGFAETGRWPAQYLILRHPTLGIELHFWSDDDVDRWSNDVGCYVRFDSPEEASQVHADWRDVPVPEPARLSELQQDPGGSVEFQVIDLHGNLVRLGGFPAAESGA